MLSRCSSCHGRKRLIGLGNMEKECHVCKGIGWVTVVEAVTPDFTVKPNVVPDDSKIDKRSKEYREKNASR